MLVLESITIELMHFPAHFITILGAQHNCLAPTTLQVSVIDSTILAQAHTHSSAFAPAQKIADNNNELNALSAALVLRLRTSL